MKINCTAGDLRERPELLTNVPESDGVEPIEKWSSSGGIWARAEFLFGVELERMRALVAETQVRFTVRFRASGIGNENRFFWRGFQWNIHALLPDEDKEWMYILSSKVDTV